MPARSAPASAAAFDRATAAVSEQRPTARLERAAQVAGAFAILVGALVLIGWWAGIGHLTRLRPAWPPMHASTALMSVLAGTALLARARSGGTFEKQLALVATALVTSIAAITLGEWLFGWSSGIDRLVTHRGGENPFRGRSSPQTALTFLLLGPALALLDRAPRRGPSASELLVLIAMAVPILALLGFAYGVSDLYGLPILLPHGGMAAPTALTVIVLGIGIFCARPASGLMGVLASPHAGGVAARHTLLALLALPLASFVVVLGERRGLYPEGVGTGLVVFVALLCGLALLLVTSGHLERKDAALRGALAEAEQWKVFFERAEWGAAITTGGRFVLVNPAFARMHGLAVEDMIGSSVTDLLTPESRADYVAKLPIIEQRGTMRFELERIRKDGSRFPVLVDITAVKDQHGRVRYRAAHVRDISEEKKSERERVAAQRALARAHESERALRAWFEATIDQMPEPVIVLDAEGRVALQNRPALALAHETGELDPSGRPLSHDLRFPSGERVPAAALPHYRALRSGERVLGTELVMVKDDRRVPVVASAMPVRIDTQIVGSVASFQDVSALKELERQRQEWISIVAHDLRQPISTIGLVTERLLQADPESLAHDRESLARVQRAVDKLERMIGDLLDASRLSAQRLTIEREPLNLRAALEDVVTTVPELRANPVQLSFPDYTPWISADRMRIDQVFRNLLSNAGKYGGAGTPVEVAVVPRQACFEITVCNHGRGIAREDMAHLFQRFGRSEDSKRAGISGIGLGLYITRGLVEAHGGRVWAESTPGESTTFHVVLPALAA